MRLLRYDKFTEGVHYTRTPSNELPHDLRHELANKKAERFVDKEIDFLSSKLPDFQLYNPQGSWVKLLKHKSTSSKIDYTYRDGIGTTKTEIPFTINYCITINKYQDEWFLVSFGTSDSNNPYDSIDKSWFMADQLDEAIIAIKEFILKNNS